MAAVGSDTVLTIETQSIAAAMPNGVVVHVAARVGNASGPERETRAECLFAEVRSASLDALTAVRIDRDSLSDPGLFFLKRFWLATPDADQSDPSPIVLWSGAPTVSPAVAYGFQNALAALPSFAIYGLLAAAYSIVYGLVGRINLAFGAMAALGGAAALAGLGLFSSAAGTLGGMVTVALAAALWAGALHGLVIARTIFLPLGRSTGQQGLVASLGLALALGEYLRIAQAPAPPWVTPLHAMPYGVARAPNFTVTLTPLNAAVTVTFGLASVLLLAAMRWTQFGRNWRAMADDPLAAALSGVDPTRLLGLAFGLASALAGAAGAVTVLLYGSFGGAFGALVGLKALMAAILGGIGSVPGAFLGAFLIALAEAVWSAFFPIEYRDLALFLVLSGLLVTRPGGLFGLRDLTPRPV